MPSSALFVFMASVTTYKQTLSFCLPLFSFQVSLTQGLLAFCLKTCGFYWDLKSFPAMNIQTQTVALLLSQDEWLVHWFMTAEGAEEGNGVWRTVGITETALGS